MLALKPGGLSLELAVLIGHRLATLGHSLLNVTSAGAAIFLDYIDHVVNLAVIFLEAWHGQRLYVWQAAHYGRRLTPDYR